MNKYKGKLACPIKKHGQTKPLWIYITDVHYPYCSCICARGKKHLRNYNVKNAHLVLTKKLVVAETFCLTVSKHLFEKARVCDLSATDFPFKSRYEKMLKRFKELNGAPAIMRLNTRSNEILCLPIVDISTYTYQYSLKKVIRIALGKCICTI